MAFLVNSFKVFLAQQAKFSGQHKTKPPIFGGPFGAGALKPDPLLLFSDESRGFSDVFYYGVEMFSWASSFYLNNKPS